LQERAVVLAHRFHGFHPFTDPERRKWQDPEAILAGIGLKPGDTFADIGCGSGFFALPAARMVGEKGKVYGLDVNPSSIADIKNQADKEGLNNLYLTSGRAEETTVCRGCADFVFFGMALHDFQDPAKVLVNARSTLKPAGRLVDLDWKKEAGMGPPPHIRFDENKASGLIKNAGFTIESVKDSGIYHYLIIARPV
jgi:ubiquinone/menaquinone biosynthesis C-methylase UbiE